MHTATADDPLLDKWIRFGLLLPDDQFAQVEGLSTLLARQLLESKGSASMFINEQVDPHRGVSGVRWSAASGAMDLLRAHYEVNGTSFVLTESINFFFLQVGRATKANRRELVEQLVQTVVKTQTQGHSWTFDIPVAVEGPWNNVLVSSKGAPALQNLDSRHDRADILLQNETAYFLFYKRIEQLEGFQREDEWFSAEAHAALRRR